MSKNKTFMFSMVCYSRCCRRNCSRSTFAPKPGEESRKEPSKDTVCDIYDKHAPQIEDVKTSGYGIYRPYEI